MTKAVCEWCHGPLPATGAIGPFPSDLGGKYYFCSKACEARYDGYRPNGWCGSPPPLGLAENEVLDFTLKADGAQECDGDSDPDAFKRKDPDT